MIFWEYFLAMFYAAWAGVCIHWAIEMFDSESYGFGVLMILLASLTLALSTNTLNSAVNRAIVESVENTPVELTDPVQVTDTVYDSTNDFKL